MDRWRMELGQAAMGVATRAVGSASYGCSSCIAEARAIARWIAWMVPWWLAMAEQAGGADA